MTGPHPLMTLVAVVWALSAFLTALSGAIQGFYTYMLIANLWLIGAWIAREINKLNKED